MKQNLKLTRVVSDDYVHLTMTEINRKVIMHYIKTLKLYLLLNAENVTKNHFRLYV